MLCITSSCTMLCIVLTCRTLGPSSGTFVKSHHFFMNVRFWMIRCFTLLRPYMCGDTSMHATSYAGSATYFERVVWRTEFADPDPQAVVIGLFPEAKVAWIGCLKVFWLPARRRAFVEVPQLSMATIERLHNIIITRKNTMQ